MGVYARGSGGPAAERPTGPTFVAPHGPDVAALAYDRAGDLKRFPPLPVRSKRWN